MNTLQEAIGSEFAQVAADGVFRDAELFTQILGNDLAGMAQLFEEVLFAMAGEHRTTIA